MRRDVLEGDGMAVVYAHGERGRPAGDVLRFPILGLENYLSALEVRHQGEQNHPN